MSINNIEAKAKELLELESFMNEINAQAEAIKDELKAELTNRGVEELQAGEHIVRWVQVLSSRFDTKKFKEKMGEDVYKAFTREVPSKRFAVI